MVLARGMFEGVNMWQSTSSTLYQTVKHGGGTVASCDFSAIERNKIELPQQNWLKLGQNLLFEQDNKPKHTRAYCIKRKTQANLAFGNSTLFKDLVFGLFFYEGCIMYNHSAQENKMQVQYFLIHNECITNDCT